MKNPGNHVCMQCSSSNYNLQININIENKKETIINTKYIAKQKLQARANTKSIASSYSNKCRRTFQSQK